MEDKKRCNHCKDHKFLSEFHKNRCSPDGLASTCKICVKKQGMDNSDKNRIIPEEKVCTKCRDPKPSSEFYKDNRYKTGLNSHCKTCKNIYNKEYRENMNLENISKLQTNEKLIFNHGFNASLFNSQVSNIYWGCVWK